MTAQASFMTQLLEHLSTEEALVWDVLQDYRGQANAITNQRLAAATGLPERRLRDVIKTLVEDYHKSIGSLPGIGVFLITNLEERQAVVDFYRGHALSLLKRMAILSHFSTAHLLEQLELDLRHLETP